MPLHNLSASDLQSRSDDLLRMAETARTADTKDALMRLAERFAQLAEARAASSDRETWKTAPASMSGWPSLSSGTTPSQNPPPPN